MKSADPRIDAIVAYLEGKVFTSRELSQLASMYLRATENRDPSPESIRQLADAAYRRIMERL